MAPLVLGWVVTGEMLPAVWAWDRDFYQEDFGRYVDAEVADEVTCRPIATLVAGRTASPPRSLADYADTPPEATPTC